MRRLLSRLISIYQKFISPLLRPACAFYPTCSEYAKQAIEKYGVAGGTILGIKRIMRCHPWQKNRIDPIP